MPVVQRYRTLVENLFRRGVLRVVISTGTLALGINAPARVRPTPPTQPVLAANDLSQTCVFGGDSVFLTALNFRQCAGRAGRRGFDNLGLVVFVGVSLDRIQRLLLSRLPKLVRLALSNSKILLTLHFAGWYLSPHHDAHPASPQPPPWLRRRRPSYEGHRGTLDAEAAVGRQPDWPRPGCSLCQVLDRVPSTSWTSRRDWKADEPLRHRVGTSFLSQASRAD